MSVTETSVLKFELMTDAMSGRSPIPRSLALARSEGRFDFRTTRFFDDDGAALRFGAAFDDFADLEGFEAFAGLALARFGAALLEVFFAGFLLVGFFFLAAMPRLVP